MLGRNVSEYAEAYRDYFARNSGRSNKAIRMLDPAPRIILDPDLGMCCAGRSAEGAAINRDIYSHTIDIILRSEALGGYRALSEQELFEFEYWELEQAKLRRPGAPPVFGGEIALVTGAASGIGAACVESLVKRGAAVIGLDIDPKIATPTWRPAELSWITMRYHVCGRARESIGQSSRRLWWTGHVDPECRCFSGGRGS